MTNEVNIGSKAIYIGNDFCTGSYSPLMHGVEVNVLAEDWQYPKDSNPVHVFICSWHDEEGNLQLSPILPSKLEAAPEYPEEVKMAAGFYASVTGTEVDYRAMKMTLDLVKEEGYYEKQYEVTFLCDGGFSFLEGIEFPKTVKLRESELRMLDRGVYIQASLLGTVLDADVSDYVDGMKYFEYDDEITIMEVR